MTKTTYTTGKAKRLAKRLNSLYRKNGTWRAVAEQYPGVNFATLNRIAKHDGLWMPKDESLLGLLGFTIVGLCKTCKRTMPKPKQIRQPAPKIGQDGWMDYWMRKIK